MGVSEGGSIGSQVLPASTNPYFALGTVINYGTIVGQTLVFNTFTINYGYSISCLFSFTHKLSRTLYCNNSNGLYFYGGITNYGTIKSDMPKDDYYAQPNIALFVLGGINGRPVTFMPGSIVQGPGYPLISLSW